MHKSLSIIIPAYNEARYIGACLEAIAEQTVAPDEVIVVDNNSNDGTAQIARRYPFVKVIHERRQGLYFSRNTGMDSASGSVLTRIDADTVIGPGWVEAVLEAFANPAVQALSGPVGYHDMPFPNFTLYAEDWFLRGARHGGYAFLMGANMALSKTAWQQVQPSLCNEPFLFEDIDIALHLQSLGIKPAYSPGMQAHVSARRFADSPKAFLRYIHGHSRTLAYHGRSAFGAYYAQTIFAAAYFVFKPLHMSYDPAKRRPSLAYFLQPPDNRPDPMDMGEELR